MTDNQLFELDAAISIATIEFNNAQFEVDYCGECFKCNCQKRNELDEKRQSLRELQKQIK